MYENMTFENVMDRCLARVSASVDKREGSIVYDAIAPAAAELAILYIELAYLMDRAFPDTETGDDLTKKCRERSVFRTAATQAVRKGYFEKADGGGCDIEIGTRFSGGDINFTVTERIAPGQYSLTAETAGTVGNEYVGTLFPIDYVPELAAARLADILIPGEDEESDDALRARYFESLKSQAFGGNIADYKNKVELLPGVGAVKVFPVWNGGGTVKIVLVDSEWGVPSSELVKQVQEAIDPVNTQGTGVGLAPIGHVVTVAGVTGSKIDVSFNLTFEGGASWTSTQDAVKAAIQSYFDSLARTWADTENLIVRVSQIETKVLNVDGVIDITGTKINQGTANISLGGEAIPVLGAVTNGNYRILAPPPSRTGRVRPDRNRRTAGVHKGRPGRPGRARRLLPGEPVRIWLSALGSDSGPCSGRRRHRRIQTRKNLDRVPGPTALHIQGASKIPVHRQRRLQGRPG